MSEESGGRSHKVLNALAGTNNIVSEKVAAKVLDRCLGIVESTLLDHCSVHSGYAMITPNSSNVLAEPVFTKDGINIVNAIEFANPVEAEVKKLITYIGRKVEQSAGDGTTTSMLLTVKLMRELRKAFKKHPEITYRDFKKAYGNVEKSITAGLKCNSWTPEKLVGVADYKTIEECIYSIAFQQAMTSSHGDIELSTLVAELMSTTPKEAWDHTVFIRDYKETDKTFNLEYDDSSFTTKAMLLDNRMLNTAKRDGVVVEDCTLLIPVQPIMNNSLEFNILKKRLEDNTPDDKPIVVIIDSNLDGHSFGELRQLYEQKALAKCPFTIMRMECEHPIINGINALYATTGHDRYNYDGMLELEPSKVEFKLDNLYIHGIVEYDEDGMHPALKDAQSPLTEFMDVVDNFLKNFKEDGAVMSGFRSIPNLAKQLSNSIRLHRQGHIRIGGGGVDNAAAIDVLTDVIKAVTRSLTNGCSHGGYRSLLNEVTTGENCFHNNSTEYILCTTMAKCIKSIIKEVFIRRNPLSKLPVCDESGCKIPSLKKALMNGELTGSYNISTRQWCSVETVSVIADEFAVVQPVDTDIELLRRFGELAGRYIFTNKIIIPEGIFTEELK